MDEERLGRLVSTHPVDNRKRWARGAAGLTLVVLGAVVLMALPFFPELTDQTHSTTSLTGESLSVTYSISPAAVLLGSALVLIGVGLGVGTGPLVHALRGGRRESFELRAGGLVHRGRSVRRWAWSEVAAFNAEWTVNQAPVYDHGLDCTIQMTDGTRVRIDRFVAHGQRIARAVRERCQHAGPLLPTRKRMVLGWLTVGLSAAGCGGALWYMAVAEPDPLLYLAVFIICMAGFYFGGSMACRSR